MLTILYVAIGGSIGSVLRFLLSGWVQSALGHPNLPNGTLVVNLAGSLAIGCLAGFFEARGLLASEARALLLVGFLGGFTTFSSFGFETLSMLRSGAMAAALGNVALHVLLGLGAVWLGYTVSRNLAGAM
ncbi:MAG: fluoride efflux transporter CrcB [Chloroflexi bacterium]|nr:fluoride efflux transporter CrcB [Chloroflexota bacterium]